MGAGIDKKTYLVNSVFVIATKLSTEKLKKICILLNIILKNIQYVKHTIHG